MSSPRVVVVGGGVIGVSCAYYLRRAGADVRLIERETIGSGASGGNAGAIAAGHPPLNRPGRVSAGVRLMLDPTSPLYVHPSWNPGLWKWLLDFARYCTEEHVGHAMSILGPLGHHALAAFTQLLAEERIECEYARDGMLDVCHTEEGFAGARHEAELVRSYGYEPSVLSAEELGRVEPVFGPDVVGAVHYPESAKLDPGLFLTRFAAVCERLGVTFETGDAVTAIETSGGRVSGVRIGRGTRPADAVVLATGPYRPALARRFGLRLPVQPGKGYHRDVGVGPNGAPRIRHPFVLNESSVFCTPMDTFVRFAGTMEFSGENRVMRAPRLQQLTRAARAALPDMGTALPQSEWCGLRPMSVDGLPMVGPTAAVEGLFVATGHGMLGLTLGPITGQLIANAVTGTTDERLDGLSPDRFSRS